MTSEAPNPDEHQPDTQPDYERMAAELMQQWQQQFVQPVAGTLVGTLPPELATGLQQGSAMAQNLMQMGQVLWQGWLQGNSAMEQPDAAQGSETAYTEAADVPVSPFAPTAAAATAGTADTAQPITAADTPPNASSNPGGAASLASVALCAELARRLDLLSQRVIRLEEQLRQR